MRARGQIGKPGSQQGFTVIEVLVAVTLLLIGIAGTLSLFVALSRANGSSRDADRGRMIAEELMEDLRGQEIEAIQAIATDGLSDVTAATSGVVYHRSVAIDPVAGEDTLLLVRVEVSFVPIGSPSATPRTTSLEMLRTSLESM